MKRFGILGMITAAIACTALLIPQSVSRASGSQSLHPDSNAYSRLYNVTQAEADEQLGMQGQVSRYGEELSQDSRITAFWIERSPVWRLVIGLRAIADAPLVRATLPTSLQALTDFQVQRYSESELVRIADEVRQEADLRGLRVDISSYPQTQRVVVRFPDSTSASHQVDQLVRWLDSFDAVSTEFLPEAAMPGATAEVYAGFGVTPAGCTSGFSAWDTWNARWGTTTAGHCPNGDQLMNGSKVNFVREVWGGSADIQIHYSAGVPFTNLAKDGVYDSSPYVRAITAKTARSATVIGGMYCKYGNVTGYGCGTLLSRTKGGLTWIPNCSSTYLEVKANYNLNQPGDSGGPVYDGSSAVGSAVGGAGGTTMFAMSLDGYHPDILIKMS